MERVPGEIFVLQSRAFGACQVSSVLRFIRMGEEGLVRPTQWECTQQSRSNLGVVFGTCSVGIDSTALRLQYQKYR